MNLIGAPFKRMTPSLIARLTPFKHDHLDFVFFFQKIGDVEFARRMAYGGIPRESAVHKEVITAVHALEIYVIAPLFVLYVVTADVHAAGIFL